MTPPPSQRPPEGEPLKFLSLFAGIGGLDLGLDRAGMRCIGQVEIDPFCRAVLAKHWPDVPRWEDVRTFNAGMLSEKPDLICGGFPCQDISNAGKRAGIDGERSGLWSEFYRIICDIRPRYVVVENVAALLVGGIERVLGDLAQVRFDAEWSIVSACALGAPHTRDRLFVISNSDGVLRAARMGTNKDKLPWLQPRDAPALHGDWMATVTANSGSAHGIPNWMDRCRSLGNAVVPQLGEFIGRRIIETTGAA